MERNVGSADRLIRLVLGLVLIVSPLLNMPAIWSSAWLGYASMIIGLVLALTSVIGTCPMYSVFGVKTCRHG